MELKEFLTPGNVVVIGSNALAMYIGYILFRAKVNRDIEEMKMKIEENEREIKQLSLSTQETQRNLAVLSSQVSYISQQLSELKHSMTDQMNKIIELFRRQ